MSREFTVMLLSKNKGRHYSFKVSLVGMAMLMIFAVCLISLTIVSLFNYVDEHRQNNDFATQIKLLEAEIGSLNKNSREAYLYKQWADRIIFRRLNYENDNNTIAGSIVDGVIPDESSIRLKHSFLDIDGFDVRRIKPGFDFEISFKLINRFKGNKNHSGYIFLIASNNEIIPGLYSSWPLAELLAGMPKDYKKGYRFSIRYLKNIKGRINQPEAGPKFNRVDLIAYSEDGNILMKKGFYIGRLLLQSPSE